MPGYCRMGFPCPRPDRNPPACRLGYGNAARVSLASPPPDCSDMVMSYHEQSRPAPADLTDRQPRQRLTAGKGAGSADPASSCPITTPDTARDDDRRNLDERPDTPRVSLTDSRPETWAKGLNTREKDGKQKDRQKTRPEGASTPPAPTQRYPIIPMILYPVLYYHRLVALSRGGPLLCHQ